MEIQGMFNDFKYFSDHIEFSRAFDDKRMCFWKKSRQITFANPFEQAGLPCIRLTESDAAFLFGNDWRERMGDESKQNCRS